jgi:hypothetical protein
MDLSTITDFFNQFGIMLGVIGSLLGIFVAATAIGKKIDTIKQDVNTQLTSIKIDIGNLKGRLDHVDNDLREIRSLSQHVNARLEAFVSIQKLFELKDLFNLGQDQARTRNE